MTKEIDGTGAKASPKSSLRSHEPIDRDEQGSFLGAYPAARVGLEAWNSKDHGYEQLEGSWRVGLVIEMEDQLGLIVDHRA